MLSDYDLDEVDPESIRILILPGGDHWEKDPQNDGLAALLRRLVASRTPIAAICAATTAVARIGIPQGRKHTSNGLASLKAQVPGCTAAADYIDDLAVRDHGLITASGLGPVEFAREIFAELGVFSAEEAAEWSRMFKAGRA